MRTIGILQVLASGVGFGFLGIFGKSAYSAGLTPGEFLALRFLIAGTLTVVGVACLRPALLRLGSSDILRCVGLGLLGYAVFSSCYFYALRGLSASLTVLLLYLYPVFVTLGGVLFFGERISRGSLIGLPLALLGLGLLLWGGIEVSDHAALLFGIGSAFFYGLYILGSKRWLEGIPPFASVGIIQISAGVALILIHWSGAERARDILAAGWIPVLGAALISSVGAMTLFLAGLQKLTNTEASVLSTAEPLTAILLATVLLGESLEPRQSLGGILVIAALVLVSLGNRLSSKPFAETI